MSKLTALLIAVVAVVYQYCLSVLLAGPGLVLCELVYVLRAVVSCRAPWQLHLLALQQQRQRLGSNTVQQEQNYKKNDSLQNGNRSWQCNCFSCCSVVVVAVVQYESLAL
jgi:hypothetical protein